VGKAEAIRTALTWTGDALLAACLAPRCACCHCALESPIAGPVCARCWEDTRSADGRYDGALRQVIHALKYEGRRSLSRPLAEMMRERHRAALEDSRCVVPVPLFPWRRLRRGFNQATELAAHLDRPVVHALWRVRPTTSQTGLTAHARRSNVRGAFRLSPLLSAQKQARFITGSVVALVDDVMTTGATSSACADVLVAAGAREVRVITLARA
jgi:ComF family protein